MTTPSPSPRRAAMPRETPPAHQVVRKLLDDLLLQHSDPQLTASLRRRVAQLGSLGSPAFERELVAIYLLLEKYLTAHDPKAELTPDGLRKLIREGYRELAAIAPFDLLVEPPVRQETRFGLRYLTRVLERVALQGTKAPALRDALAWLRKAPEGVTPPLPLGIPGEMPRGDEGWASFLPALSHGLFDRLRRVAGETMTRQAAREAYQALASVFLDLDTFPAVLPLVPAEALDTALLEKLNHGQLRHAVERTLARAARMERDAVRIRETLAAREEELARHQAAVADRDRAIAEADSRRREIERMEEELREAREEARAARLSLADSRATPPASSSLLEAMGRRLRHPMNAMLGTLDLLLDTNLSPEQRTFAGTVRGGAEELLASLDEILDFSAIESGSLELDDQPFELRAVVEESLRDAGPMASRQGLDLAYLFADFVPGTLRGDRARVRQILDAALAHVTARAASGEVLLRVTSREVTSGRHEIHVAVHTTDPGPRPSPPPAPRSSRQAPGSSGEPSPGSAPSDKPELPAGDLALATARMLCERMGGRLWIEREGSAEGDPRGEAEVLHLTLTAPSLPSRKRVVLRGSEPPLRGCAVLVIGGDATQRRVLTLELRSWGMAPAAVATGVEALDLLRSGETFAVVIADAAHARMPVPRLAAALRRLPEGSSPPVVLLSSGDPASPDAPALEELPGVAAVLDRPVRPSRLWETMVAVVQGDRPARGTGGSGTIDSDLARRCPHRILLAESDEENRRVAESLLGRMGYRPVLASTSPALAETLRRTLPDVVVCGLELTGSQGVASVVRAVLAQASPGPRPAILALLPSGSPAEHRRLREAGASEVLETPLRAGPLQGALERLHTQGRALPAAGTPGNPPAGVVEEEEALGLDLSDASPLEEPGFAEELLDLIVRDAQDRLQGIRRALENRDLPGVRQAATILREGTGHLASRSLRRRIEQLEEGCRAGALEKIPTLLADLEKQLEETRRGGRSRAAAIATARGSGAPPYEYPPRAGSRAFAPPEPLRPAREGPASPPIAAGPTGA